MEDNSRAQLRGSPLRAVVTPTTVDRTRCSTYDNVEVDVSNRRQHHQVAKPPRSNRVVSPTVDPVLQQQYHHLPRPCPSPVAHYRGGEGPAASRTSPSPFGRTSSQSPSRCAPCSGRSTPTARQRSSAECRGRVSCSPWKELDPQHPDNGDSTDSDPVRQRPTSGCKVGYSHRGAVPPLGDCWHHGSCSPCHTAPMRYHWHGTVPPPHQSSCGCHSGYMPHGGDVHGFNHEELQQKIFHLESEKEHLSLQASVLTEQVDAQNEKIKELEANLNDNTFRMTHSEERLKKEIESHSAFENGKLELMTQISSLKIKLATAEQKRQEFEDKSNKLESELVLTSACLAEREVDLATLKSKLPHNGKVSSFDQNSEVDKLKSALSSVITANDEKEQKIQELNTTLNRYKKLQELVLSNHIRKGSDGSSSIISGRGAFDDSSNLDTIMEMNNKGDSFVDGRLTDKPPHVPRSGQPSFVTSSPIHDCHNSPLRDVESLRCSPVVSLNCHSLPTNFNSSLSQRARSSDNVYTPMHKTPPAKRHYGTIPRPHGAEVLLQIHQQLQQHKLDPSSNTSSLDRSFVSSQTKVSQSSQSLYKPAGSENIRASRSKTSGTSFGKGFFRLRSSKRSSSAPELVPMEMESPAKYQEKINSSSLTLRRTSSPNSNLIIKEKPKGLRKIFGRLKRTGSENLDNDSAEFKRGGIRATAGPRLGWTVESNKKFNSLNFPFSQWNSALLVEWLHTLGLGMYSNACKKHIRNGEQLLKSSNSDFEKELGIKNPLHRKKLLLAIVGAKDDNMESFRKIDYHWVVRWLDDIGLPQYKDSFFDARVDGTMLHYMIVEDLFNLKVTNQLHHICIRRGIQVLRENGFNPQCLKRRCLPGDADNPTEVSKWTNHRVMEWLRTVDLSEYAPNLRGSGVHGGLMVYEPRFNAELLATLLNIPPNKTLLRRHLSTQFKQLVGMELMQKKREWEAQANYCPLSPSAKVKVLRRGQLSLIRKKNKVEVDFDDYVCPMDSSDNRSRSNSPMPNTRSPSDKFLKKDNNLFTNGVLDDSDSDFNIWTELLKDEKAFDKMTATNV